MSSALEERKLSSDYWPSFIEPKVNEWLFQPYQLQHSPSIVDGYLKKDEIYSFSKCFNLILWLSKSLNLRKPVVFYSMLYVFRFYQRCSLKQFHYAPVTLACCFIATKELENQRKSTDFAVCAAKFTSKKSSIDRHDKEFWDWQDGLLTHEQIVMDVLCFDFVLTNPYQYLNELMSPDGFETSKDSLFWSNSKSLEQETISSVEKVSSSQIFLIHEIDHVVLTFLIITAFKRKLRFPNLFFKSKLKRVIDPKVMLEVIDSLTLLHCDIGALQLEENDIELVLNESQIDKGPLSPPSIKAIDIDPTNSNTPKVETEVQSTNASAEINKESDQKEKVNTPKQEVKKSSGIFINRRTDVLSQRKPERVNVVRTAPTLPLQNSDVHSPHEKIIIPSKRQLAEAERTNSNEKLEKRKSLADSKLPLSSTKREEYDVKSVSTRIVESNNKAVTTTIEKEPIEPARTPSSFPRKREISETKTQSSAEVDSRLGEPKAVVKRSIFGGRSFKSASPLRHVAASNSAPSNDTVSDTRKTEKPFTTSTEVKLGKEPKKTILESAPISQAKDRLKSVFHHRNSESRTALRTAKHPRKRALSETEEVTLKQLCHDIDSDLSDVGL